MNSIISFNESFQFHQYAMNCLVVTSLRRDKLLMKSGFMPLYFPFHLVFTPLPHFLVSLLSFRRIRAVIPSSSPRHIRSISQVKCVASCGDSITRCVSSTHIDHSPNFHLEDLCVTGIVATRIASNNSEHLLGKIFNAASYDDFRLCY